MESKAIQQFVAASHFFTEVVGEVPPEQYDEQWSGEWRILDLIGHGNRANTLVIEYMEHPVESVPPDYFTDEAIAARGRAAVDALGDDPPTAVRASSERTLAAIEDASADASVGTPMGTMPLPDYLPSRAAELVLHGLDLAIALDLDITPSDDALLGCLAFLADRGVARGEGLRMAQALSGRADLPAGFSVY